MAVLDQGVARSAARNLPGSTAGARFPQLCLRKLYVVCGRDGGSGSLDDCLQEVSALFCFKSSVGFTWDRTVGEGLSGVLAVCHKVSTRDRQLHFGQMPQHS